MASKVNVYNLGIFTLAKGQTIGLFYDVPPGQYPAELRRVRCFNAVPYVFVFQWPAQPGRPIPGPGSDTIIPPYEQRVAISRVFHLLKPYDPLAPFSPRLQVNLEVTNLSDTDPVTCQINLSVTDN
jgi:hypothetical protein